MCKFTTQMSDFHNNLILGEFNTLKEAFECGVKNDCGKDCKCGHFSIKVLLKNGREEFVKLDADEDGKIYGLVGVYDENGNGGYQEIESFMP